MLASARGLRADTVAVTSTKGEIRRGKDKHPEALDTGGPHRSPGIDARAGSGTALRA